jgi:predicted small secreted protein
MRIPRGLVLGLLLALSLAGCGDTSGTGRKVATAGRSTSTSASAATNKLSNQERALKYGQCMRDNGVPYFPDPQIGDNGEIQMELPDPKDGTPVSKETLDSASAKCKQFLPNGGEPPKLDPQTVEQLRKFAQCMRDNGVPKFPDPQADGGIQIDGNALGMAPGDPTFDAAQKACAKFQPAGPSGGAGLNTGGGSSR